MLRVALASALPLAFCAAGGHAAPRNRARDLLERAIGMQHGDDGALYGYERVQQRIEYHGGVLVSDETYRLVPTGTGRLSLLIKRSGRPVDLASYQRELRDWQQVLSHAMDASDARERHSVAQRQASDQARAALVNDVGRAFDASWLGETCENGRRLARIGLAPNPDFVPDSRESEWMRHVHAIAWIDEQSAQLVRGEAQIASDISLGGGLLGKIYRGGHFDIEQIEVGPGVWLPSRIEYSIRGRRLFISFDERKVTVTSRYRYIGGPLEAARVVRGDLASGRNFPGDP